QGSEPAGSGGWRAAIIPPPMAAPLSLAVLLGAVLPAQEWTRFRGPDGSGLSGATTIPAGWSESSCNWRVKLPGIGHSAPVLWGEKVFLTSAEGEGAERLVLCLRAADGSTAWARRYASKTFKKHQRNSYATSTPATDAERVYAVFSTPEAYHLRALDHTGGEVWSRDLGPYTSNHGDGASPVVFEDLVVLGNEQDGESFLIALDRKTGETRWKTSRATANTAYATPAVYREGDRPALLFSSQAHGVYSVDARTGEPIWEAKVFDKRAVSSPIFAGGLAIGTCGSGGGGSYAVGVRPGGKGDVAGSRVAWKLTRAIPYVPSPIAKGDLLFLWGDMGIVTCAEISTGKVLWQNRVGGNYSGSPVCAGERIYCISDDGEAVVIAASREYKLLARNPLGEASRSTPAVAGGRMYLRTESHLISVGGRKPEGIP
ncbi:MAG: PQQ-binding-like beta-propeller repeat protein, partial [Candidatus Methylomirabilales bacterium]